MTVTIRDVAKRLGLSITTVSRALDGYADVAEDTRQLIYRTAHEMGYAPNQAARQLRRQRADSIGYILPAEKPRFSDPFFAEFIAGLGDEACSRGVDLLVSSAQPGSENERLLYERWLNSHKVDGFVLNRLHTIDWRAAYLQQADFPFVTFERPPGCDECPSVEVNNRLWARKLIDHLVSLGHRRIAFIGASPDLVIQAERFAGYQDGLAAHDLRLEPQLVYHADLTSEGGFLAGQALLQQADPPTAIACISDTTAFGVLHAAREAGKVAGRDLAVTGFDGVEGFEHTQPPLTTVNQPIYQIARRLVDMLMKQLSGALLAEKHVKIDPTLEIRESTIGK